MANRTGHLSIVYTRGANDYVLHDFNRIEKRGHYSKMSTTGVRRVSWKLVPNNISSRICRQVVFSLYEYVSGASREQGE